MNPPFPPPPPLLALGATHLSLSLTLSLSPSESERVWIETHFLWADTKEVGIMAADAMVG